MKKIPYILFFVLLSIAYVSYDMFQLHNQEELWGHRPMFLLIFIWAFFLLFRAWRSGKKGKPYNWKFMGLSTLSGTLLAISFPGFLPVPVFMFVGFVPLLFIENDLSLKNSKSTGKAVFRYAFNAFWVFNILTTWWVTNASLPPGIFANVANALLMSTAFWLFHKTKKVMPKFAYVPLIAYWMSFEYMHLNWDLSWPWLMLGNSFAQVPWWVQWYEFTGAFGGTILLLVANILAFKIVKIYNEEGRWPKAELFKLSALILLPLLISVSMYYTYEEKGEVVNVVVVQPNYEPHFEKFSGNMSEKAQMDHFLDLSASKVDSLTDYLVFPETSFKSSIADNRFDKHASLNRIRNFMSKYDKLTFVGGASVHHVFERGEKLTSTARIREREIGDPFIWESYNAALEMPSSSPSVLMHKKSKFVPGAEIFPFKKALFFLRPLVDMLGGSDGLGKQSKYVIFDNGTARVAPVICYESVYGEYFGGYMRSGANLAFIMTNDGWWDDTPGYRQHLNFARLRAIETRRDVARAANTGSSAFINQRGDILQSTNYNEALAISGEMHKNEAITFYTQWGDMLARIALFLTAILLLNTVVKGKMKEKEF